MRFFRRGGDPRPTEKPNQKDAADPFAVYLGLRGIPLGEQGGPSEPFENSSVVAVLLDWGQPNGCATIAAMADGTTSLYTSTGGGVIGAGAHAPVREANRRLMLAAQEHLEEFSPTTEAPIPADGRLAVIIRTTEGLRRAEVSYADLVDRRARGQAVFDAANDVTTAIHVVSDELERGRR